LVKEIGLWGGLSVKVVNPDAGIDNNHGLLLFRIRSHAIEVAVPGEFTP
jgi:hypothetical protein